MKTKAEVMDEIRANIAGYGHHIYVITGGPDPRFAYTIGLKEDAGVELVLAGASYYSIQEVGIIIDDIAGQIRKGGDWRRLRYKFGTNGVFSLGKVHDSWSSRMLLGALDYYKTSSVETLQILPGARHRTIDVPDLKKPWSAISEPAWQWLEKDWDYPVPKQSVAVTNLDALKGKPITEAVRWEEDKWELFAGAGPDVDKADVRTVPLGTLMAADRTLEIVTTLDVSQALRRDPADLKWRAH